MPKVKRKKQSRRSKEKYPALKPELNLKTRYELIESDYIDKLSEKEKAWLNKFNEEYVNSSLNTKEPRKNLHRTKKLRKDCYDRNNSRNRDILTRAKASGTGIYLEDLKREDRLTSNPENKLIEELDQFHNPSDQSDDNSDPTN